MNMAAQTPEVLVVGLGAMGAATAYQLAKCGIKVVGIDRFTPPHIHGSTHGETRITRQAIGEGAQFVPLALRSHQLWREIEAETGMNLLNQCGGIIITRAGERGQWHGQVDFLGTTIRAAESFGIAHQQLDATAIAACFPQFILQGDEGGYYEPGAGYLNPEACVSAQLTLAGRNGAELRFGEMVVSVATENGKTIVTTNRARYSAGTTVICAGAWIPQLVPPLSPMLTVSRQVLAWFQLDDDVQSPWRRSAADGGAQVGGVPVYIWQWGRKVEQTSYGFPPVNGADSIKIGIEQQITATNPDQVQREVGKDEIDAIYAEHIDGKFRGVTSNCIRAVTCLYTSTADANFVIDRLPHQPDTIVVSACSGHGFKHSAAIGEAVAEMMIHQKTPDVLRAFVWPQMTPAA